MTKRIKLFVIKIDFVIKLFIKLVVFTDGREWVCPLGRRLYKFVMRGLEEGDVGSNTLVLPGFWYTKLDLRWLLAILPSWAVC